MCVDVREREGKGEALNKTQYCTAERTFDMRAILEPLLFEEGDLPTAKVYAYDEYRADPVIARGMPKPLAVASVSAKRSTDDPLPTYFARLLGYDPGTSEAAFAWWYDSAPPTRADVSGIGERAFQVEDRPAGGISHMIIFLRCHAVIQVDTFAPAGAPPVDFDTLKRAAEHVDRRIQAAMCPTN